MRLRFESMSDADARSISFGLVRNPALPRPETWQEQKSTLFDQSIFGLEVDFCCACGKYRGREFESVICDICGVKIGEAAVMRRVRFGHINFGRQIPHPWFEGSVISVIPVLPIAYRGDRNRTDLDLLYSRVVHAADLPELGEGSPAPTKPDPLCWAVRQLFENEYTAEPLLHRGRPARSLCHFGFCEPGPGAEELGLYLAATMLKIVA